MKKKVLFVLTDLFFGYRYFNHTFQLLQDSGCEISIFAPDNVKVSHSQFADYMLHRDAPRGSGVFQQFRSFLKFGKLHGAIDVVVSMGLRPNLFNCLSYARVSKRICIVSGLGNLVLNDVCERFPFFRVVFIYLYALLLRRANVIVFQNSDDLHEFTRVLPMLEQRSLVIPGCGYTLRENMQAKPASSNEGNLRCCFVGRLLQQKGIRELIAASKYFPDVTFDIVGGVDTNPSSLSWTELRKLIAEQKNITLHGELENPEDIMKMADYFVLPSYREGLPQSGIEALALGLPVLATDVPGCRDICVDQSNGFIFEARSVSALVLGLKKMNSANRLLLQKNSRKLFKNKFSAEKITDQYLKILE